MAMETMDGSRRRSLDQYSMRSRSKSPVLDCNNFQKRSYRPTASAAYGSRHSNHFTSMYNAQMYLPAVGGFPAAYLNPCSHAPVVLSQGGDGFYRKQGSQLRPPY